MGNEDEDEEDEDEEEEEEDEEEDGIIEDDYELTHQRTEMAPEV